MSTQRTSLIRGPGYLTFNTATTPSTTTNLIQFADDAKAVFAPTNDDLVVSTQGAIDKTRRNRMVKLSGAPVAYCPSQSAMLAWLFAQCNALPVIGASLCGATDTPVLFLAQNGDQLVIYNACVPKPPDLTLDIGKNILGPLEIHGLIRNTYDPETASAFYAKTPGVSYSAPVLLQAGDLIGRQRYYGNWTAGNTASAGTNFTNFQGKEGITISFEADWQPEDIQGMTVDYKLGDKGLRAMAKLIPVGPAGADIEACLQFQGAGSKHGSRLSANTAMGDCVFTGQIGGSFTIKNAVLETAGYVFGGKPLRVGEIGLVGTFNMTATPSTGGVLLS